MLAAAQRALPRPIPVASFSSRAAAVLQQKSVFLFEGCIIKISPERLLEVSRVIIGFRDQILNPVRLCRGHWKNSIINILIWEDWHREAPPNTGPAIDDSYSNSKAMPWCPYWHVQQFFSQPACFPYQQFQVCSFHSRPPFPEHSACQDAAFPEQKWDVPVRNRDICQLTGLLSGESACVR